MRREFEGTERFEVIRRLGAGAMGIVYEARDRELDASVALKMLRQLEGNALLRFKNEFRALQDVHHPNLIKLGELIESEGRWFFTMELIDGSDLLAHIGCRDRAAESESAGTDPTLAATIDYEREATMPDGSGSMPVAQPLHPRDASRVRAAFSQLAQGLIALHEAGKVHRDVKPSNVRVAPDGRVILLDFGLITEAEDAAGPTGDGIVGTVAYMSPEQAAAKPVGPPADWYSFGAMLYEVLTGAVPHVGANVLEVLMAKLQVAPEPPAARGSTGPRDLEVLCMELLALEPAARPTGAAVLQRLGDARATVARGSARIASTRGPAAPFLGRDYELTTLRGALADARAGLARAVYIHGPSGVGKSALVRDFTDVLAADANAVTVLRGRCYERESVPYKAFDGVIDDLSRHLSGMSRAECNAYLPRHAQLLTRLFPTLSRIEAFAQAPATSEGTDPQELRNRVFSAVRELMQRLADRSALVLVIDDLHWADADSLHMLSELVRPPDPPPLLLLITSRDANPAGLRVAMRAIELGPLELRWAKKLARMLLSAAHLDKSISAIAIATEALGHPMYISELVRHAAVSPQTVRGKGPRLDAAIWSRASQLERPARDVLELAAVAGAPIDSHVVREASELPPAQFEAQVSILRAAHLIRTRGERRHETIEPYHDRVREAVVDHLEDAQRLEHHRQLARALERADVGAQRPQLLLTHLAAIGDTARAAEYAERAGRAAASALAFERAAGFYRQALQWAGDAGSAQQTRALRIALGDALVHAGAGVDAVPEYLAAAEDGDEIERIDLRRRAAEELLRSGQTERGVALARSVLADLGLRLPVTSSASFRWILWFELRLRLRGIRWKPRAESECSELELARVDASWSLGCGLLWTETYASAAACKLALLLALRAGEPSRVTRLLATEAAFSSAAGFFGRGQRLLELSRRAAEQHGSERARFYPFSASAMVDYEAARFSQSASRCEEALGQWRAAGGGRSFEQDLIVNFSAWSDFSRGDLRSLDRKLAEELPRAERAGMRVLASQLAGMVPLLCLRDDDTERAREAIDHALSLAPDCGPDAPRHDNTRVVLTWWSWAVHLYDGRPEDALAELTATWRTLRRAPAVRTESILKCEVGAWAARVELACACGEDDAKRRDAQVGRALEHARRVGRESCPLGGGYAALVRAGVANLRGDADAAVQSLRAALVVFDELDVQLYGHATRRRIAQLTQGDDATSYAAVADGWMAQQAVRAPGRMADMLIPGWRRAP